MRAFSLLEAIFASFLLSLIFLLFYQSYLSFTKNKSMFFINQDIFELEKELENKNLAQKHIELYIKNLDTLGFSIEEASNENFKFYSIKPNNTHYKQHFKDEKGL